MPVSLRRRSDNGLNPWPGYVDALSTLLMVIIFVLLVFVLAQAFLSVTLSSRDKQLDQVNQEMAKLTDLLSLERTHAAELRASVAQLEQEVATGNDVRTALAQRLAVAQGQLAQSDEARQALASQLTSAQGQLADDKNFSAGAKAQIELLNQQVEQLRAQIAAVAKALDLAEATGRDKDAQIVNLGQKLNAALASKVEELQQYRSEFFGRLRQVLAKRPGISVVGDRFVFQSEVLFPVGSAELSEAGVAQIKVLADTIKQIGPQIPANIHWVMRVDGHTDRQPISGWRFASNWELSAARAITVVKLLIADGVAPEHLAATGLADYQPLDPADTPSAYAKNRRIELRLTDR